MANSTSWKPGQSGNPKGRPPKQRALTTILEKAGNRTMPVGDKRKGRKHVLAEMLWSAVTTGKLIFPAESEADEPKVLELDGDDWFDVVQFLYKHIDGPARSEVDVTSGGEKLTLSADVLAAINKQAAAELAAWEADEADDRQPD